MALSEIEKLERRYTENPQGLTFAPLAEVHRKNGDVNRALELLRPGLQLHPNYTPASIVLGRCHLDLGDLPSAESAFGHVLSLDGENVIALKALADIAERLHRFDQAERWLSQLLTIDRSNDDAREQLTRIEAARSQTSKAAAEPSPEPVMTEPPVEPVAAEEPAPIVAEEAPAAVKELEPEAPPAGLEVHEPEYVEPAVEQIRGLVGTEVDTPGDEFMVETSEDIVLRSSGGSEFQMPDASQELFQAGPRAEPQTPFAEERASRQEREAARAPEPVEQPVAGLEPVAALEPVDDLEPVQDLEPVVDLEPVADLESVADLEPIADFDSVAELEPVAGLEPAAAPQTQPELEVRPEPEPVPVAELVSEPEPVPEPGPFFEPEPISEPVTAVASPAAEEPWRPAAAPRRPITAAETKGESVATFFGRMLAARPPAGSSAPATHSPAALASAPAGSAGAPTRPAADALSLSSVFGEETSALPPAVPAPGAPANGVSFDEFFSPPGAVPGARASRASDSKTDDLDQFHAWLQNLKR